MKKLTLFLFSLLTISVLSAMENDSNKQMNNRVTKFILTQLQQAPADKWCKYFSCDTICNKSFKELAIATKTFTNIHKGYKGLYGVTNKLKNQDVNRFISSFTLFKNKRGNRELKDFDTELIVKGQKSIAKFEKEFGFRINHQRKLLLTSDDNTECFKIIEYEDYRGIPKAEYLCNTEISFDQFAKEMDDGQTFKKIQNPKTPTS